MAAVTVGVHKVTLMMMKMMMIMMTTTVFQWSSNCFLAPDFSYNILVLYGLGSGFGGMNVVTNCLWSTSAVFLWHRTLAWL